MFENPSGQITATIIGVSGYVGAELYTLLRQHPAISDLELFHSGVQAGEQALSQSHPRLRGPLDAQVPAYTPDAIHASHVFLATPHEVSAELLPALLAMGKTVFDLSGAYRLRDAVQAAMVYGLNATQCALLPDVVYGLPEFAAAQMHGAQALSVPGCFPTAATLALKPLTDAGLLASNFPLIVNAVSGVSGAGKKAQAHTSFCEVSLTPYGLPTHRHTPEIAQNLCTGANADLNKSEVVFTPHLGNFARGILVSACARIRPDVGAVTIRAQFDQAYAEQPLIRLLPDGSWPALHQVAHTPYADIAFELNADSGLLRVFCAIDNLQKGAAAQAVQIFNAQRGLPINCGLLASAISGEVAA